MGCRQLGFCCSILYALPMKHISQKQRKMLSLLDEIGEREQEIQACSTYYRKLEREAEQKRSEATNSEEKDQLSREIATLSAEFEKKVDLLREGLHSRLLEALDLSSLLGPKEKYAFKTFWDYATSGDKNNLQLDRILNDLAFVKQVVIGDQLP